ncbi:carbohydrate binding domain-containing protein [Bacteroides caecigallinarum]|nr:carbohydrate binding domain-containing protein [Bacteroides caecigallinarum]
MKNKNTYMAIVLSLLAANSSFMAKENVMTVHANKIISDVSPTMYGLFFEDINFGADGGLYAELVKNRSFEFTQNLMGWNIFGNVTLMNDGPFNRNPHYVRLGKSAHPHKHSGIENEGFFGMGLKAGNEYRFSVWARGKGQRIRVELIDNDSMGETQVITSKKLEISSDDWKKYQIILKPEVEEKKAHLRIFLETEGNVDLEHVSLFPVDTWKNRENGLRKDLVQALADLSPDVFRFPGGCIVEGTDMGNRYQWKETVGQVENRPTNENRWHYTFPHRFFPDYFQSYGLGFYEYFQLSEDIGAEPLPILNCGLLCQYQNNDDCQIPADSLDLFVQDALDLIEFANGDINTKWGKLRAEMGHPEPFNLKYLGIGNEQWGQIYVDRLKVFVDVIRKQHPEIKIVGSSGPYPEGEEFEYLWKGMKELKVDLVDEHFYRPDNWFISQGKRYDNYDRKGPKVFAGEYACHVPGKKWNHFRAALLEAAFMTGLERNADMVRMATYAPLLAHIDGWQWRPDLIWFDNLSVMKTCSYYVQQLYATNKGTHSLKLTMDGNVVCGDKEQNGLFASAVWDENNKTYIVKVVNTSENAQDIKIDFKGLKKKLQTKGECILLHSEKMEAENTLENPNLIVPKKADVMVEKNAINDILPPMSFMVYKLTAI